MADLKLSDEPARMAALRRYAVLDTPAESPFDKITALVQTVLGVPISAVSLIDTDRQWFKSVQGLEARQTPRSAAFCAHTIRTRDPMVVPDAALDPRFLANPLVTGAPHIASYAGVPLETPDGYNIGSLCAIDTVPRSFAPDQIDLLKRFAALVVSEFELRRIAGRDDLTGALTRRAFIAEMDAAIARLDRDCQPSALILLDVDHFKVINDTHGHPAGDVVLRAIAACCSGAIRPAGVLGRVGGEEFAILLADADADAALAAAEEVRALLEALRIAHEPQLRVTASFGIAPLTADDGTSGRWLARADVALYTAKRTGRNRCRLAGRPDAADARRVA